MRGRPPRPAIERFEEKYIAIPESGCWIWLAALDWDGYGSFFANGKDCKAYRWSYEYFKGKIPHGMQLDHLCRVRCCVNPHHLEAVTPRENVIRGIMPSTRKEYWASRKICKNGLHDMVPDNLIYDAAGWRRCKACRNKTQANSNENRNKRRRESRLTKV